MKSRCTLVIAALLFGLGAPTIQARDAVSVDFFYDNLQPYGDWREIGGYGYCWQPYDVGSDWRPYSDGRWVYTDAGWTWDSNEPFGWAVYHYGRWVDVGRVGWVWVPGTEWGPGWVSWRRSPQYTGWAPLPPEARLLLAIGLSSWVDNYYDIGPNHYRFVDNRNFGARRLNSVFVDQSQNFTIIRQTTNITNITYVNNVVYNGGPVYDQQVRQSREPIQRFRLDRRQDFDQNSRRQSPEYFNSRIDGDSLSVLALPFTGKSASAPRKLAERVERAEVNRGWKNAGTPEEIVTMREKLKSKEKPPEKLPPPNAFVKVTDEASVRQERPIENQPAKPKGKGNDKPEQPRLPPIVPKEKMPPGERPPTPEDPTKGKPTNKKPRQDVPPPVIEKPIRPGDRPPSPADAPKIEGTKKPMRPDMPPGFPQRQIRPEDRPPTPADAPPNKSTDKPGRPDMPPTSAEKPNRGGRNKVEMPQLPKTAERTPPQVTPKVRDQERLPQIMPPQRQMPTQRPEIKIPKIVPIMPAPAPKPAKVNPPAMPAVRPAPMPPKVAPPRPNKVSPEVKPDARKKKEP